MVAKSYFTDSYKVTKGEKNEGITDDNKVPINDTNIAWESDKEHKFKRLDREDWKKYQWIDVEDGKFFLHILNSYCRAFHCLDEDSRAS